MKIAINNTVQTDTPLQKNKKQNNLKIKLDKTNGCFAWIGRE